MPSEASSGLPKGLAPITYLIVRGAKVLVTNPIGSTYRLHVDPHTAGTVFAGVADQLQNLPGREAEDFLCIGVIEADHAAKSWRWQAALAEPRMNALVDEAARRFLACADAFGRWPSFADMLATRFSYDVRYGNPVFLPPVDWFWLTANQADGKRVHRIGLYPDGGLLIHPDDGLIRLYSSGLATSLALGELARAGVPPVQARHLHCLGCFLGGAAAELIWFDPSTGRLRSRGRPLRFCARAAKATGVQVQGATADQTDIRGLVTA